ncbi:chymotrypsin B-like isoform X3 [Hydractinia symbiolongicarpus]|nr:chymotrypsin B-like isoform X3 [Hydractinia symbiolongicarpus]
MITRKPTATRSALCGISSIRSARIINGNISKPGEWPWQVALLRDNVFICGAMLISPTWVLTAAQCIDRISVSSIKVVLGEDDREKASGSEQIISAAHFETHGKYNQPTNLNNDIALIRLSKPARLNKYVKPICLPLQGTKPGKAGSCYLSGWGKSTQPGQYVNRLHHAKLSIMESDKCKKSNSKYVPITPQMLCATGENMASGCYGDNGGPFVCQAANERWTLHGVFSWGSPRCSVSDAYSVFARVSSFRQWIDRFV